MSLTDTTTVATPSPPTPPMDKVQVAKNAMATINGLITSLTTAQIIRPFEVNHIFERLIGPVREAGG